MNHIPHIEALTTPGGITIRSCHRTSVPIVNVAVRYPLLRNTELQKLPGAAYMLALLMDEGAGGLSAFELSDRIEYLGSFVGVGATNEHLTLSVQCMSEKLEETLGLASLILTKPNLEENDFKREQARLLQSMRRMKDSPETLATAAFFRKLYAQAPQYAFLPQGTIGSISACDPEGMRQLYSGLIRHNTPTIFVTGDFDIKIIEEFAGKISTGQRQDEILTDKSGNTSGTFIIHKEGSVQTEIRLGLPTGGYDSSYFAKAALNSLFGGQFFSRLNRRIREELGYTYGIQSGFAFHKNHGFFSIGTSVDISKTGDTITEILRQMEQVKENISNEEIEFTKSHLTNGFRLRLETSGQILGQLLQMNTANMPDDFMYSYIPGIHSLNVEELHAAARKDFLPDRLTTVLVGDENEIRKSYNARGLEEAITVVTVEELL